MKKWLCIFPLLIFVSARGISQSLAKDILLIKNSGRSTSILPTSKTASFFYRERIQTQIGKTCVYEMKCGEFAKEVFKEFGPLKGFFLAVDRSGRCTHISTMETLPNRLNSEGKIIEGPGDYRLHQ